MRLCRLALGIGLGSLILGCQTVPPPAGIEEVALNEEPPVIPAEPLEAERPPGEVTLPSAQPDKTTVAPETLAGWISLESFCKGHGVALARLAAAGANTRFRIACRSGPLDLKLDSRVASCNGVQFWLAYGPRSVNGEPQIHALDARKNLTPFLASEQPGLTGRRIVVDAGHGGRDLGTQSLLKGVREKDLTLDWALRVGQLLKARGWEVVYTRTGDRDLALSNRVEIAERAMADLFVSLHFNSGLPNTNRTGIETYCLTPAGLPSTLVRYEREDPKVVYRNNQFDDQNLRLAIELQRALVKGSGAQDQGVRRARFMSVLRGQSRPAALVEGGYLTSPVEAPRIASPEYRQQLAESVVAGIETFAQGWSQGRASH